VLVAAFALFLLGLMLVYPFVLDRLHASLGTRGLAGLGLLASVLSIPIARALRSSSRMGKTPILTLAVPLLLVLAGVLESFTLLELVPAWVHLCVGLYFLESARGEDAAMAQAVRWLVPEAPDFVVPYCRRLTALWGVFFVASACASAGFALWGSRESWRLVSGPGVCGLMALFTCVEFIVRKTWFRYYFHGGPFDRLWSRLFPAEATAQGRRSLEAVRQYRESG